MTDEKKNKKNRVNLGGTGSNGDENSPQQNYVVDDYETPPAKTNKINVVGFIFFLVIVGVLLVFLFKQFDQNQKLKQNVTSYKNELTKIKHEKEKNYYGDLSLEFEPKDAQITLNGEVKQRTKKNVIVKGFKMSDVNIKNPLIFEFSKPGYYPIKLELGRCNWKLRPGSKDKYYYENRDIHLAVDENAMMMIEQAEKEKEKEEKKTKKKKKKKKRGR